MPKHSKITVVATPGLLKDLLLANTALKGSRKAGAKDTPDLHALIVQVMQARRDKEPVLAAAPRPPEGTDHV